MGEAVEETKGDKRRRRRRRRGKRANRLGKGGGGGGVVSWIGYDHRGWVEREIWSREMEGFENKKIKK